MRSKFPAASLVLITVAFSFLNSCKFDSLEELQLATACDSTFTASYLNDVVPILSSECYQCHGSVVAPFLGDGNRLEGYDFLKVYVDDGRLLCSIKRTGCAEPMPQGDDQLPDSVIAVIETWVCQGSANN